jgi:ankyrin repeat protein
VFSGRGGEGGNQARRFNVIMSASRKKLMMSEEEWGRGKRRRDREKKIKARDDAATAHRERVIAAKDSRVSKDERKLMGKQDKLSFEWNKRWNFDDLQKRLVIAAAKMQHLRAACKARGLSFECPPDIKGQARYGVLEDRIEHYDKVKARQAEAQKYANQHRAQHKDDKPKIKAFNTKHHEREMDKAIREAKFSDVITLLRSTAVSPDYSTTRGLNALVRAIYHGQVGIVRLLLEAGAGINTESPHGWTPLIYACYSGQLEMVAFLLDQGKKKTTDTEEELKRRQHEERADPELENKRGWTPLIAAAKCGHESLVVLLIGRARVNIDHQSTVDGMTALMVACRHRHLNAVVRLLRAGARSDQATGKPFVEMKMHPYQGLKEVMNCHGHTCRTICSEWGYKEILTNIEKYASKYAPKKVYGQSGEQEVKVAPEKLTYKETLAVRKRAKEYIAMNASLSVGDEEGAVKMVEIGLASPEQEEPGTARTALILVASSKAQAGSGAEKMAVMYVERLLKVGADPSFQNRHGHTALMASASQGSLVLVALLLKAGADSQGELADMDGNTATTLAGRYRQPAVVKLLKEVQGGSGNNKTKGSSKYGEKKRGEARQKALSSADSIVREHRLNLQGQRGNGAGGTGSMSRLDILEDPATDASPFSATDGGLGLKSSNSTPAMVLMDSATPETIASVAKMQEDELAKREKALDEARGGGELQRMHDRSNYASERKLLIGTAASHAQVEEERVNAEEAKALVDRAQASRRLPPCEKCTERRNAGMGRFKMDPGLPPMRARHRCMNCSMVYCDECFERVHRQPKHAHHRSHTIEPGAPDAAPKSIMDTISMCRKVVGEAYKTMGQGETDIEEAMSDQNVWELEEKKRQEFERRMEQREQRWEEAKRKQDALEAERIEQSFLEPPELNLARLIVEGEDANAKKRALKEEQHARNGGPKMKFGRIVVGGSVGPPSRLGEAIRLLRKTMDLQLGHFGATHIATLRTTNELAAVTLNMGEETTMLRSMVDLQNALETIRAEDYKVPTEKSAVQEAVEGEGEDEDEDEGRTIDETDRAMELAVDLCAQLMVKGGLEGWYEFGKAKALDFYDTNIAIWTEAAEAEAKAGRLAVEGMLRMIAHRVGERAMALRKDVDSMGGNFLQEQRPMALMASGMRRLSTLMTVSGHEAAAEVAPKSLADLVSTGITVKHAAASWLKKTKLSKAARAAAAAKAIEDMPKPRIAKGGDFLEHALELCPKWMLGWRDEQTYEGGVGALISKTSPWSRVALAVLLCSRDASKEHNAFYSNLLLQVKEAKEAKELFEAEEMKTQRRIREEAREQEGEGLEAQELRDDGEQSAYRLESASKKKVEQLQRGAKSKKKRKELDDMIKFVDQGPAAYHLLRKIHKALLEAQKLKDISRSVEDVAAAAFRQFRMDASEICHQHLVPKLKCLSKKKRAGAKVELQKMLKIDGSNADARTVATRSLYSDIVHAVFNELHEKAFGRYITKYQEGRAFASPFDPTIVVEEEVFEEGDTTDDETDDDIQGTALQALLAKKNDDGDSVDDAKIRKARARQMAKGVRWTNKAEVQTNSAAKRKLDTQLAALQEQKRKEFEEKKNAKDKRNEEEDRVRRRVKVRRDAAAMLQRAARRRKAMKTMSDVVMACFEPIYDDNYGRFYFHNKVTGESTWEKPRLYQKFVGLDLGN